MESFSFPKNGSNLYRFESAIFSNFKIILKSIHKFIILGMKGKFVLPLLFGIVFMGTLGIMTFPYVTAQEETKLPDWFENNHAWLDNNQIDDELFLQGMQYLIDNNLSNTQKDIMISKFTSTTNNVISNNNLGVEHFVDFAANSNVSGCETTNSCFVPHTITIIVGDSITWNTEYGANTITAGDLFVDPNLVGLDYPNGFDSGFMPIHTTFTHQFDTEGTFPYFSIIRPWASGVVIVEPHVEELPDSWTPSTTTNVSSTDMFGVSMSDANNGVAVGNTGTIVYTTNGGVDWTAATTTNVGTTSMRGVSMSDANNGVAVGLGGTIVFTTNGGVDWTAATTTNVGSINMVGVSMSDANNGVAVGNTGTIVFTTNGGVDWTAATTTNVGITLMEKVSMSDANNGVAVGGDGQIAFTSDGGDNWTDATTIPVITIMRGVSMIDVNNGVAVGSLGNMFFTTNGGVDWTAANTTNVGTTNLHGVSMSDVNNGVAVGNAVNNTGIIVYTTNGGVDWTEATAANVDNTPMNGVSMSDANNGVAVGFGGTIVFTGCPIETAADVNTIISSNCTVRSDVIAGGSVRVQSGAVMTIPNGATLDINFVTKNLTIESGSGVLIKSGGTIT